MRQSVPIRRVSPHKLQWADTAFPVGEIAKHYQANDGHRGGGQPANESVPLTQKNARPGSSNQPETGVRQQVEPQQRNTCLLTGQNYKAQCNRNNQQEEQRQLAKQVPVLRGLVEVI